MIQFPVPGDVFVRIDPIEDQPPYTLWETLLEITRIRIKPLTVTMEYRHVTELAPGKVFYLTDESKRLYAAWLCEFQDWMEGAHQLADAGVARAPAEIINATGTSDIPFDLPTKEAS